MFSENNETQFQTGDSVRLKMDSAELKTEFLSKNLDHSEIGYIHDLDCDGDVSLLYTFLYMLSVASS